MQYYPKVLAILGLCHPFDNTSVAIERDLAVFQIANDWLVLRWSVLAKFSVYVYMQISYHICVNQTVVFSDTNSYNIISTPLTLAQRPDLTDVPCSAATMSSVRRTEEVDVSGAVRGAGRTSLFNARKGGGKRGRLTCYEAREDDI